MRKNLLLMYIYRKKAKPKVVKIIIVFYRLIAMHLIGIQNFISVFNT